MKELQQALKKETSDYQSKLSATTKKYGTSREDCLKLLKSKMNSLEKHSENLSETFVSGDSDMNTFLQVKTTYFFYLFDNQQIYISFYRTLLISLDISMKFFGFIIVFYIYPANGFLSRYHLIGLFRHT